MKEHMSRQFTGQIPAEDDCCCFNVGAVWHARVTITRLESTAALMDLSKDKSVQVPHILVLGK